MMMLAKNGVRNFAVRNYLYRTVVIFELFFSNDVRVVAVYGAIHADYTLDHTCNSSHIVRNHHYRHTLVQLVEQSV